jgi:hypothetical protein
MQYSDKYPKAVSDFLRQNERNDLAWMQFLEENKLQQADDAAYKAAVVDRSINTTRVFLSIAKLTRLARQARGEHVENLNTSSKSAR